MSEHEDQELDLSDDKVVTKYKAAAEICNKAIAAVIEACKDGAKVVDLCKVGDDVINKECAKSFKGKQIEKGVAFPTCVSPNSIVGHFSPLADNPLTVKDGDLVKIDLGCHIDGFISTQAQTVLVGTSFDTPITGKAADLLEAARTAFNAAIRLIKPGKRVSDVAPKLAAAVEPFGVALVEGVMSHQMKQFVIDGNKVILNKPSPEHKVEDQEFEPNEVYAIDIVVSSGEGKPRMLDEKETTVYKRALDVEYKLKLKASRAVFSEISKKSPPCPSPSGALLALTEGAEGEAKQDLSEGQLRLGLVECLSHSLLHPYPVLHEKQGDLVAQIKGTVLLMPNGSDKVTSAPEQKVETDKKVEDAELLQLLATSLKPRKSSKKKSGTKAAEATEAAA
ncbi:peptidase M24, structural domain-containing protein [Scenedesmus sp. NREL 46B-D3]|nr:peptidase M24, structural domain-containing protein [Scenedesmus sp. NREL 46B-D3]